MSWRGFIQIGPRRRAVAPPVRFRGQTERALAPITLRHKIWCGMSQRRYPCRMRGRIQKIFSLSLDHLMPDGPPVFLVAVVLLLLIVNGATPEGVPLRTLTIRART
jgi:hypothetical protein